MKFDYIGSEYFFTTWFVTVQTGITDFLEKVSSRLFKSTSDRGELDIRALDLNCRLWDKKFNKSSNLYVCLQKISQNKIRVLK
jgi:hypothetical protein